MFLTSWAINKNKINAKDRIESNLYSLAILFLLPMFLVALLIEYLIYEEKKSVSSFSFRLSALCDFTVFRWLRILESIMFVTRMNARTQTCLELLHARTHTHSREICNVFYTTTLKLVFRQQNKNFYFGFFFFLKRKKRIEKLKFSILDNTFSAPFYFPEKMSLPFLMVFQLFDFDLALLIRFKFEFWFLFEIFSKHKFVFFEW